MTTLNNSIKHVIDALNKDDEYRQTWHSNLAIAYVDCCRWHCNSLGKTIKDLTDNDIHQIGNSAAEYFIN